MIKNLAAIQPVATAGGSTSPTSAASRSGMPEAAPTELVQRFEALLGQAKQASHHPAGPSAVGELVAQQDASMKTFVEHVDILSNMDHMRSMEEVMAVSVHLQVEAAIMSWKINTASAVAQSGKSAVQTLMRNQ